MATYYVSTSGSDSNAGTPAAPFLHPPGGLSYQATSTSAGVTLADGDIIKFRRGQIHYHFQTMTIVSETGLTLTAYSNDVTGADDSPEEANPIWEVGYPHGGGSWTNETGIDANLYSKTYSSSVYGVFMDKMNGNGGYSASGSYGVAADAGRHGYVEATFSNVSGDIYKATWATEPMLVYFMDRSANNDFRTSGTCKDRAGTDTTPAAGEWGWTGGELYVNLGVGISPEDTDGDTYRSTTIFAVTLSDSYPYHVGKDTADVAKLWLYKESQYTRYDIIARGSALDAGVLYRLGDVANGNLQWGDASLYINDSSNITIENIDFWGGYDGIIITGYTDLPSAGGTAASDIYMSSCNIYSSNYSGVRLYCSDSGSQIDNVNITNCTFDKGLISANKYTTTLPISDVSAYPSTGQQLSDGYNAAGSVSNCTLSNSTFTGWGHNVIAFQASSTAGTMNDNVVELCTAVLGNSNYCRFFSIGLDAATGKTNNNIIRRNDARDCNVRNQLAGENAIVEGNLFAAYLSPVSSTRSDILNIGPNSSTNCVCSGNIIANNTFIYADQEALVFAATASNACGTNYVRNNVFINGARNGTEYTVRYIPNNNIADQVVTNNIFWTPDGTYSGTNGTIVYWDDNVTGSPGAKTVAQMDALADEAWSNNLQLDPLLDSNYAPTKESPCIGAGTDTGIHRDHNGTVRKSQSPDIGAIWFDGHDDTTVEPTLLASGAKR